MALEFTPYNKQKLRNHQDTRYEQTPRHEEGMIFESINTQHSFSAEPVLLNSQNGILLFQEKQYLCAFCKGVGEKPKGSVCSSCHGKKQIKLTPPVVKCAACKGRGTGQRQSNYTCSTCNGNGWVAVREPVEKCKSCLGRGKISGSNLLCVSCRGVGVRTNYHAVIDHGG